tara:strand:+ start:160 stop:1029 length:870 start_codon:yes stop_codon:yes gene_type:complete
MLKVRKKNLLSESTIRTPSNAKYFATINNVDDLNEAINFCKFKKIKFKIIGNGSNILFSRDYYDDILFLKLGNQFKSFKILNDYVEIGGSFSLIQAGRKLINEGYRDYIFFNLIPATIGGAVRQNAGTGADEEIKNVCRSCLIYDVKEGCIKNFDLKDLNFKYRDSIIKQNPDRFIIVSAKFNLINKEENIEKLLIDMKDRVKEKIDREPKGYCFGSTFMNNKLLAWEYIDAIYDDLPQNSNLYFSNKHKNWIINQNSSGKDVLDLIENAQKLIKKKFNIDITTEVDII